MITRPPDRWQREAAGAIRDPVELLDKLGLAEHLTPGMLAAARDFPLRVTGHYLSLIRCGDLHDPLLRQVLPVDEECRPQPGYDRDPVGDGAAFIGQGLLRKYRGRALLIATGACAIHCRYCFRRHFGYSDHGLDRGDLAPLLERLATCTDVDEVILSGGDPLSLSDDRLGTLVAQLARLPQLRRIRIHTRQPVVLPSRITDRLVAALRLRIPVAMVLHVNHARELSAPLAEGIARLRAHGVHLLNQSVLLRGVNDRVDRLAALSERLFDAGILPYYLHQLDRVAGAAHFAVDDDTARALHRRLAATLPGYLVPRLVREIPGQPGKSPL